MTIEEQLREQNDVLNQRLDKAKQVFSQMKADMTKQQERIKELECQLESQPTAQDNTATIELSKQLNELNQKVQNLQEMNDSLANENAKLEVDNHNLNDRLYVVNNDWSLDKLTLSDLQNQHAQQHEQIDKLNEKLKKNKQVIDELNKVVSECNDTMNDKDMQLAEMTQNIELLTSEKNTIQESLDEANMKIRAMEDELYETNTKLDEANAKLSEAGSSNEALNASLKAEIESYESKLNKARLSFAEQKDKICSMSGMIDTLTQEKNDLIGQLKEAIENLEQTKIDKDTIDQANEEIEVLKGKLKKAEDDLAVNNESVEKAMALVKQSEDKRKADIDTLQGEINRQGELINKMMEELKEPLSGIVKASENVNLLWSSFIRDKA